MGEGSNHPISGKPGQLLIIQYSLPVRINQFFDFFASKGCREGGGGGGASLNVDKRLAFSPGILF